MSLRGIKRRRIIPIFRGPRPAEGQVVKPSKYPKAHYTLDVRSNRPYKFHNLTDVHINGNGLTVICNNQEQAFSFTTACGWSRTT